MVTGSEAEIAVGAELGEESCSPTAGRKQEEKEGAGRTHSSRS